MSESTNDSSKVDVKAYWRTLIAPTSAADVDLVGHPDMGRAFNQKAYQVRWSSIARALEVAGCDPRRGPIFEAAYGVGFYLSKWRDQGCTDVAGIDISEQAGEKCRGLFPDYDLRVGDLSTLASAPDWEKLKGRFHLVTAIDVLYHIVDDIACEAAVKALSELVAPGGFLLLTDKFHGLTEPVRETPIVRRKPLAWYDAITEKSGLRRAACAPLMWCSDPSTGYGGFTLSRALSRAAWVAMRLPLKYLPRNGLMQETLGSAIGTVAREVDLAVLPYLGETPNLAAAIYTK
jgi:SAM-dependent methyltransferase